MSQNQQNGDFDWAYRPIEGQQQPQAQVPFAAPMQQPNPFYASPTNQHFQQGPPLVGENTDPWARMPSFGRSVSDYPPQFAAAPPAPLNSNNPFYGSTPSSPIEPPASAPPTVSSPNNPFATPDITPTTTTTAQETPAATEEDLADAELGLKGKEKRLETYDILDVYWDQQFSAVLTAADITADKDKKSKDKDRYSKKKPEYFFESRCFSTGKIQQEGDTTLYACGRDASTTSSSAGNGGNGGSEKKKGAGAYEGKGVIVGCVRYHHANWKGHWKMHVCMGNPSSDTAHFEWMEHSGVVKERQWLLEGFNFTYTTSSGESKTARRFRVTGTQSAIPDGVKMYTKYGNFKMTDADTGEVVAVYLKKHGSVHKRGRVLVGKGLSTEFRDFAVLCLMGVDERRLRDGRNASYGASGWWVHMMARGLAGDRLKAVKDSM